MSEKGTALSTPTQATTTPSFIQEIDADAVAAFNTVKSDVEALWNYESPVFVTELKTLAQQLLAIAAGGLTTVLQDIASGKIKSTEALSALVTHTAQTAEKKGLATTVNDARAAASQVAAAAASELKSGKPQRNWSGLVTGGLLWPLVAFYRLGAANMGRFILLGLLTASLGGCAAYEPYVTDVAKPALYASDLAACQAKAAAYRPKFDIGGAAADAASGAGANAAAPVAGAVWGVAEDILGFVGVTHFQRARITAICIKKKTAADGSATSIDPNE